jgi:hypothetical protein
MRRLIALLLIASSGWLLFRTGVQFVDIKEIYAGRILDLVMNLNFIVPAIAGVLVLIGGVIALAGGVGGAMLAIIGGAAAAGFGFYLEQPVWNGSWRFWENDLQLGVAMLVLAAAASILGRD